MSRSRTFSTDQAAKVELCADLVINLLGHLFAFAGVKGVGGMRGSRFADGGAQGGLDHHIFIIGANLLENIGRMVGIEMVNQRSIQAHHQTFARRHAGRFLQGLRLDGELIIRLQRIDQMNALAERLTRLHSAEQREHADVPRAHPGHGAEQQNHQQKCGDAESDQSQKSAACHRRHQ